jgi:hypothetical protein
MRYLSCRLGRLRGGCFRRALHPLVTFRSMPDGFITRIRTAISDLQVALTELEPGLLTGEGAADMVKILASAEHGLVAARTMCARRVEQTRVHKKHGHSDAATWMASETGEPVSDSAGLLAAARQMEKLPEVKEAFRDGKLSPSKARQVAGAATTDPSKERQLLEAAENQTLGQLRATCDRVRRQAESELDEAAKYQAIRRRRYYKDVTEPDGAVKFDGRMTPDDGAKLRAELMRRARKICARARSEGRRERFECYMADALMELVNSVRSGSGGVADVHVTVEAQALLRGHSTDGETCEIKGVGHVPVATARQILGDGFLSILVKKGKDVTTIASAGRAVPAAVDRALRERDKKCCVPGCDVTEALERDHRIVPFIDGGPTSLENLALLCRWHHYQRTYCGFRLGGDPELWIWSGPQERSSDEFGWADQSYPEQTVGFQGSS